MIDIYTQLPTLIRCYGISSYGPSALPRLAAVDASMADTEVLDIVSYSLEHFTQVIDLKPKQGQTAYLQLGAVTGNFTLLGYMRTTRNAFTRGYVADFMIIDSTSSTRRSIKRDAIRMVMRTVSTYSTIVAVTHE